MTENIETAGYLFVGETKLNHCIYFSSSSNNEQIGCLDFNGETMKFEGNAEESAKLFFDYIAGWFRKRLEEERAYEREACASLRKEILLVGFVNDEYESGFWYALELYEKAIRARSNK